MIEENYPLSKPAIRAELQSQAAKLRLTMHQIDDRPNTLSKAAIRAVLSSEAANLRVLTHEIDDREFQGSSLAAGRVIGELRRIARDLEDLRADVAAIQEKEQPA